MHQGSTVTSELQKAESDRQVVHPKATHLYVVLGCGDLREVACRYAVDGVTSVLIGRGDRSEATRVDDGRTLHVKIRDPKASRDHARLHLRDSGWVLEDRGAKNGTWVSGRRVDGSTPLQPGATIETGETFLMLRTSVARPLADVVCVRRDAKPHGLVTLLPELVDTFDQLASFARTDGHVAILGETGSGKDVVARAYHQLTGRPGDMVPVNCGALPAGLLEAALFGHKKGAYSGAASDGIGYVRAAQLGTLFLDEIGDLPIAAQAALLRVVEAREVVPVGAAKSVPVDVRIVCATHRDIPRMVHAGEFRQDLWARLSAHVVRLPPLRERLEDISFFLEAAIQQHAPERADRIRLSLLAARTLLLRRWPNNIRELNNVAREALAFSKTDMLGAEHFPEPRSPAFVPEHRPVRGDEETAEPQSKTLEEQRATLERLLEKHHGNVSKIAIELGKGRTLVHEWLNKLGLDARKYRRTIRSL